MKKQTAKATAVAKPKAARCSVTQLVVTSAYEKTFSSGKTGFYGQAIDPSTGQKYQIVGAVRIGS